MSRTGDLGRRRQRSGHTRNSGRARAVEISFADRYSLCIMNPQAITRLDDQALLRLAGDFYNDSYLVDQNACSSPHLVVWHTPRGTPPDGDMGKRLFWEAVEQVVRQRYTLEPVKQIDKYSRLLHDAVALNGNAALLRVTTNTSTAWPCRNCNPDWRHNAVVSATSTSTTATTWRPWVRSLPTVTRPSPISASTSCGCAA